MKTDRAMKLEVAEIWQQSARNKLRDGMKAWPVACKNQAEWKYPWDETICADADVRHCRM